MFELKYAITDADMRAVNKKAVMLYFALYLAVAVVGVAVGIIAAVLSDQTLMLVMGIILIVLGAILTACAVLLLVSPKNLIASAVKTGDAEYTVTVDDDGIKVVGADTEEAFAYAVMSKVKNCKSYLLVYVGKDKALMIKNAFTSADMSLEKLYETLEARHGCPVNPLREIKEQNAEAPVTDVEEQQAEEQPATEAPSSQEQSGQSEPDAEPVAEETAVAEESPAPGAEQDGGATAEGTEQTDSDADPAGEEQNNASDEPVVEAVPVPAKKSAKAPSKGGTAKKTSTGGNKTSKAPSKSKTGGTASKSKADGEKGEDAKA